MFKGLNLKLAVVVALWATYLSMLCDALVFDERLRHKDVDDIWNYFQRGSYNNNKCKFNIVSMI